MPSAATLLPKIFLGMKVKKFGISATNDQDRVNDLGASYFQGLSKSEFSSEVMQNEFNPQDITSMICENPSLRAEITVLPFRAMPNVLLNMGTSIMFNRVENTTYSRNSLEHFNFSSFSNEAALDGSLVYNQKLWFLNLYGGVGTNLGYTFNGFLHIYGNYYDETAIVNTGTDGGETSVGKYVSFNESHLMKNSLHQRVFLQGGVAVLFFKRLEIGFEGRRGVGYRFNTGNPLKFTNLVSTGLSVKWNLK